MRAAKKVIKDRRRRATKLQKSAPELPSPGLACARILLRSSVTIINQPPKGHNRPSVPTNYSTSRLPYVALRCCPAPYPASRTGFLPCFLPCFLIDRSASGSPLNVLFMHLPGEAGWRWPGPSEAREPPQSRKWFARPPKCWSDGFAIESRPASVDKQPHHAPARCAQWWTISSHKSAVGTKHQAPEGPRPKRRGLAALS